MAPSPVIEAHETPAEALARELGEEIAIAPGMHVHLGKFHAEAANEHGRRVEADVFEVPLSGSVAAAAEIEEIRWVDPSGPLDLPLAILSRDHIMPLARARARKESHR